MWEGADLRKQGRVWCNSGCGWGLSENLSSNLNLLPSTRACNGGFQGVEERVCVVANACKLEFEQADSCCCAVFLEAFRSILPSPLRLIQT